MQGLKAELEGRVPHSVIQENLRYYDAYITEEVSKGASEEEVIESLGGPRIIGRTIIDAALDTEDRSDGYETYGSGRTYQEQGDGSYRQSTFEEDGHHRIHYVDFSKWYVRLIAGAVVFLVILLLMTIFFGLIGLAGVILSYIGPVLMVLFVIWLFKSSRR